MPTTQQFSDSGGYTLSWEKRLKSAFLFIIVLVMCSGVASAEIEEDFSSLDGWKPLDFPKIEQHTEYEIIASNEAEAGDTVLRAQADASASGLIFDETFAVADTPIVEWRWKVEDTVPGGDAAKKDGDDYACRIYIIFPYDSAEASFGTRLKYNAAKIIYGEYPPLASLNYIWANREHPQKVIPNAFTEQAMMFPVETGRQHVGEWRTYRVDIREDYRDAFGEEAPATASLAIMSDTDNTGASATAFIDYIRVRSNE